MVTHTICDDPGATDDWESREGHLKSSEATIRFSPITRAKMEIETWKWCSTTWLVNPLRNISMLTCFGHELTLTSPDLRLRSNDFPNQIDFSMSKSTCFKPARRVKHDMSFLFSCLSYKKSSMKKIISVKNDSFAFDDPWSQKR